MPINTKELIEELSVEIHKLYCEQYLKDHGTPYWTNGDYEKLEERVKEYDRNIARYVLSKLSAYTEGVRKQLKERKYDRPLTAQQFYNDGIDFALSLLQETN